MRWPPWSPPPADTRPPRKHAYLTSEVVLSTTLLTTSILSLIYVYYTYLRRIPTAAHISPTSFHKRSLFGTVTSVGDGDNVRLFHTPGGRLAGWGWFPGRRIPSSRKDLKDATVHVRLAGVDAPEGPHFGKVPQPYSKEALAWLKEYVEGKRVRAYIYRKDHYGRAVASVKVRKGLFRRDVGLQMLRAGMATLYEAKFGAEFGELRAEYEAAEALARKQRKGMWKQRRTNFISPYEFKRALREGGTPQPQQPR